MWMRTLYQQVLRSRPNILYQESHRDNYGRSSSRDDTTEQGKTSDRLGEVSIFIRLGAAHTPIESCMLPLELPMTYGEGRNHPDLGLDGWFSLRCDANAGAVA